MLHFYFSLLHSFRITSFRIPLELFHFVRLFSEAAGASAAPDGLRSNIVFGSCRICLVCSLCKRTPVDLFVLIVSDDLGA